VLSASEARMANFPTHIAVGTIVSGALATVTVAADMIAPENVVAVTLAGVLGSVLPDIDLKDSRPSRAMFAGLAVFFHFSYHRGIWHSLLATVFCAFLTAWIYSTLLGRNAGVAWLAAGFMAIGYLTHLTLDEIYSVDVMDTRIKASFGTALKPVDFKHPGHSAAMGVATVLLFLLTPPTGMFLESITSRGLWTSLQQRLLPQDRWFGVDWRSTAWLPNMPYRAKAKTEAAPPAATSPISTGSIAPGPAEPAPDAKTKDR